VMNHRLVLGTLEGEDKDKTLIPGLRVAALTGKSKQVQQRAKRRAGVLVIKVSWRVANSSRA
jgi:hypothetical protein